MPASVGTVNAVGRLSLVLAVALAAGGARADVVPGDVITAENVDKVKDLVSPGLEWCIRHGFPITVVEPKKIEWPQAYREATERYSSQVRLGADGLKMVDYVAGLPFPNLDPSDPRVQRLADIVEGLDAAPRHRGIHVGGFVLTEEPLRTVVPIEPASMEDRTVIQWEKDDLDPVGLVKIDLLGLGMLTVVQDCLAYVRRTRGIAIDLGQLDCADPAVYDDPDRFDVTRDVRDLITFGNGPHYCLGANLARQEMGCMIEAMLDFLPPGSRWLKDQMEFQAAGLFRRPVTLPIEIAPTSEFTRRYLKTKKDKLGHKLESV